MDKRPSLRDDVYVRAQENSSLVLIAIGVVVVLLVGVAVVIALQPPPTLDPATPEGAAQGYVQALHDGDTILATSYMTEDLRRLCDDSSQLEGFGRREERPTAGATIVRTEVNGSNARVDLTITVTYGEAPFDAASDTFDETLVMENHGERWLISEPAWPWDRYSCEREG